MRTLYLATNYLRWGFTPVPLKPFEETPAITDWQRFAEAPPDEAQVQDWFEKEPVGVGIVLGDRLAVLDFENRKAFERWERSSPEARQVAGNTWTVRAGRRIQVWLRLQQPAEPRKVEGLCELRTGKQVCAVPPTVLRVDGEEVECETLIGPAHRLMEVSPEVLEALLDGREARDGEATSGPGPDAEKKHPWKSVPGSEFHEVFRRPEVQWVWEDLLAVGHIADFYALWKSGKTTLVAALLKQMESGGELAGKKVYPGKALVVTEEPPALWMTRIEELGLGDSVHFICRPFRKRPTFQEWESFLSYLEKEEIPQHGFRLVVFDALPSLWPVDDENDATRVLTALLPLQSLAEQGCAILLVRHPRKSDGREGTAGRGSGALSGFVDFIVEMRRYRPEDARDTRRVLTVYSRYEPFEVVIRWNGGADYEVLGSPEEFSGKQQQQQLLDVLAELGEATTEELAKAVGIPHATASKRLNELQKAGKVVRRGSGKRGDPYRWALAGKAEFFSPPIEDERGEKKAKPPTTENRAVSPDLSDGDTTKENQSGDGSGGNISPRFSPHFSTPESSKERYVTPASPGEAMLEFLSPPIEEGRGEKKSPEGEEPDFFSPRFLHGEKRGEKKSPEGDFLSPRSLSIRGEKKSLASPGEAMLEELDGSNSPPPSPTGRDAHLRALRWVRGRGYAGFAGFQGPFGKKSPNAIERLESFSESASEILQIPQIPPPPPSPTREGPGAERDGLPSGEASKRFPPARGPP